MSQLRLSGTRINRPMSYCCLQQKHPNDAGALTSSVDRAEAAVVQMPLGFEIAVRKQLQRQTGRRAVVDVVVVVAVVVVGCDVHVKAIVDQQQMKIHAFRNSRSFADCSGAADWHY